MDTLLFDTIKHYDSPEQYAEAFQQMFDAREKWREQIREQEASVPILCTTKFCQHIKTS